MGGMARAIENGLPKLRIEEAAARTQARIDSGRQPVVGVNMYRLDENENIEVLAGRQLCRAGESDREAAAVARRARQRRVPCRTRRAHQRRRIGIESRNQPVAPGGRRGAGEGDGRRDLRRDGAGIRPPRRGDPYDLGCVRHEVGDQSNVEQLRALVERFAEHDGRRPRILVAKIGQDGHDRGQKVIATAFADLGFDVDVGPLFQTPAEVARQAIEADVHIVGVSSLAAGHLTLVPELKRELAELDRSDILVVVGGVIPPQDFEALRDAGAAAIFPPGTVIADAAIDLMRKLNAQLGYE